MIKGDEFRDEVDHGLGFEGGEGDAGGRFVEAGHVFIGAEESDLAGGVLVGFHAFETFEGVVENAGGGVEAEVLVGGYAGGEPALGGGPFDGEHVVCLLVS